MFLHSRTRQTEARLVKVAHRLVRERLLLLLLSGGGGLPWGNRGHHLGSHSHLAHRPVVLAPGDSSQLRELNSLIDQKTSSIVYTVWASTQRCICKKKTHPAASLYPLVHVIWEGLTSDVAPTALHGVKGTIFQHNLALADHHQRTSTHLCPLKDVILNSLGGRTSLMK